MTGLPATIRRGPRRDCAESEKCKRRWSPACMTRPAGRSGRARLGYFFARVLLQLTCVRVEIADAFAQLLDAHGVFVVLKAIRLFVQVDQLGVARRGALCRQLGLELA